MGIQGLLPDLADITKKRNLKYFRGKRAAIDAYVWLHKGAYQCASDLAKGFGLENLIAYCVKRVQLFLKSGVTPVVIFDGGKLKMKGGVETDR